MVKTYKPRKYVRKTKKAAAVATQAVAIIDKRLKVKCDKRFITSGGHTLSNNTVTFGFLNIGTIPRFNADATTQAGIFKNSRTSDTVNINKVDITMGFFNKVAYDQFIRVVCLRNTSPNELISATGTNWSQTSVGVGNSYSTDMVEGRMYPTNMNLYKSKKDLIFDKVIKLPSSSTFAEGINYARVVRIKKAINTKVSYEAVPTVAASQEIKGGSYYLFWWIINSQSPAVTTTIEIDWVVNTCFSDVPQ